MTKLLLFISAILICLCNLSALDIKKDIEGDNCAVTEPIGKFTFNFTDIQSEFGYHVNGNEDNLGQYSFNLCKPLSKKCNNQTAAACLKKHHSSEEVVIGYESKIYWNEGQIRFSYAGEKCNEKTNYTLNVLMHCDYRNTKNDFLGVFHLEEQCEVNIVMKTPKACFPIPDNVKSAKLFLKAPSNKTLNFSPLKTSNYFAGSIGDVSYVVGFPILYSHGIMCEAGSTVCAINDTETDLSKKFKNIGSMTSDMKFENDHAVILLTSNEECKDKRKYSSKIIFKCDKLVEEGAPKFMKLDDCVYYFEWETKFACFEETSCQVSGINGEVYDFSSLAGIQYQLARPNKTGEFIHFSLCSAAQECGDSSWGSCIVKSSDSGSRQTTRTGMFESKLLVDQKAVFLKYNNGAKCNDKGDEYSTKIEFILADNSQDEEVVLIEDGCEIVIHVKTLLMSQNVKNCVTKDQSDVEIDLRPLIDYNGNYEATVATNESSDVHYYLNICRPLNSKYTLNCHGNTAACRTVIKDKKHEEEISLGHYEYSMTTAKGTAGTTNVIMKYFDGSKCPEDEDESIITKITFFCDESAGLGNPILKSREHCEYSFDFPTNLLCSDRQLKLKSNDSCELINEKTNKSIDLKVFGTFENGKVDICDNTPKVYTLDYKNSMILIEYAQDNKDIQVQLKCDLSNSSKIDASNDQILVMNESTLVCPIMNVVPKMMKYVAQKTEDTTDGTPKKHSDEQKQDTNSSGFSLGYIFLIVVLISAFAVFYIVLRNPERREILLNIVKFRSRSTVRYARNMNDDDLILG